MAKLPPVKRFLTEDYASAKDIPGFCSRFFYPLNLFLNATYTALQSGLTLGQNLIAVVSQNVSVTCNASGVGTTTINWTFPQTPPVGVTILSCTLAGVAANAPLISWSYSGGVISITLQFISITAGNLVTAPAGTYTLSFWATGG